MLQTDFGTSPTQEVQKNTTKYISIKIIITVSRYTRPESDMNIYVFVLYWIETYKMHLVIYPGNLRSAIQATDTALYHRD